MKKWFKSFFAWEEIYRAGVYSYQENSITGKRQAIRINSAGYSPVDYYWINKLENKNDILPTGGSGVIK